MGGDKNPESKGYVAFPLDPCNTANMLHVGTRIVFTHDPETKSFHGRFTVKNQCCRYVTYVVRPSKAKKFKLKPRYGFIAPWKATEVEVITEDVARFQEIAQEFFGVFAYPVHDKRQLEKKKLSVLWRAHGSDLFPLGAAEFHKIPFILPKNDDYFDDIGMLHRIPIMSYIARLLPCHATTMVKEDKPVDSETFHLHWPIEGPISEDTSLAPILRDWHRVSKKIQDQTQAIQQSFHVLLAILITAVTTFFATSYLYLADAAPFCQGTGGLEKAAPSPLGTVPPPAESGSWLSWVRFRF